MALTQVAGGLIAPSTTLTTPIVATTMGVGGATPSTSGSGITFPATQSDSSNANTLDDYEEGTWTPALSFSGGNGTAVINGIYLNRYTKIGRFVLVECYFDFAKGTASGDFSVTGFPFNNSGQRDPASILFDGAGAASNVVYAELFTNFLKVVVMPQSTSYASNITATQLNANPYLRFTVSYTIA
jgi:hypothetical protein